MTGLAVIARRWLAVGAASTGVAWLVAGGLPIYDGIGSPDEPYRYVAPPPGYRHTPAPTIASDKLPLKNGTNGNTYLASGEIGPQISIYVEAGSPLEMVLPQRLTVATGQSTGPAASRRLNPPETAAGASAGPPPARP